jgi:Skp family chaperone for outer membrane proteins
MKKINFLKLTKLLIISFFMFASYSNADYPNTSIAVIDLNLILTEAKAAKDASEQIEEIAKQIEEEIAEKDKKILEEQNKLIESQAIMAPEAFETQRIEYENKLQNYNTERQAKLISIDNLVATSRQEVLDALSPILEEISNEKGITIVLEKNTVLLNAENMDITNEALKKLNKQLPSIKVSAD